jgi:integrase
MSDATYLLELTDVDREVLGKRKILEADRARIPHLWEPFREVFLGRVSRAERDRNRLYRSFRFCAGMMLELDRTYWAFTWDLILPWREEVTAREADRSDIWKRQWDQGWRETTATLFFLGVLPYSESIYGHCHKELARKWLGEEEVRRIEDRFWEVARSIGYVHERQVRGRGASVLFGVMAASGKREPEELTSADFEHWESRTGRSPAVASSGVAMAQRVLAAMGYLRGESPRTMGAPSRESFTWGRTAPDMAATFERFLDDLASTRRPGTVSTYVAVLRRFGDWLGQFDPEVRSVADVRRRHIEAYKRAVLEMKVGDHANPETLGSAGKRAGKPFSAAWQARCISCVKAFFDMIEVLEYPERPGRQLFTRGDIKRVDDEVPRFIPDSEWHRLVTAVERLNPRVVAEQRLPLPYERTRAVLGVLLETGLRAGELCRLDTGCVVAAQDAATGQATYWLRVPVGKLRNDRLIPIRPGLVELVDAWMRKRGPQPLLPDERTGKQRDFLFAWQGTTLSPHSLNDVIAYLCGSAGVPRYTSHRFRHTLAVQWRKNGMRIETISRMLGHKDLKMTVRYAAVMPETARREFDEAFAAIDEEHRASAQVRVYLSPEAHLAASGQWRESLWVDLGIGFCGLTAYIPCENRLACLPCANFVATKENLPLYERQRSNLIELSVIGEGSLPAARKQELDGSMAALDRRITDVGGRPGQVAGAVPGEGTGGSGEDNDGNYLHPRPRDRQAAH